MWKRLPATVRIVVIASLWLAAPAYASGCCSANASGCHSAYACPCLRGFYLGSPYASHLGFGAGYPGLHHGDPYLSPYRAYPTAPPRTVIVIPGPADRRIASAEDSAEAAPKSEPAIDYRGIVERARRHHPRGVPAIERIWNPEDPVPKP